MTTLSASRLKFFRASRLLLAACLCVAALFAAGVSSALACACCSNEAWRNVEVEKLEAARLAEIGKLRFAKNAKLMLGEADDNGIKGLEDAEENYELSVTRQKDRILFSFRDDKKRSGTLTLVMPKTISIFEVDPRDSKDEGAGPVLYKEWKLNTAATGDGMFKGAVGGSQKMTLVLHGRGNACTEANDFGYWTLLVYGPVDKFTMYGKLEQDGK